MQIDIHSYIHFELPKWLPESPKQKQKWPPDGQLNNLQLLFVQALENTGDFIHLLFRIKNKKFSHEEGKNTNATCK